MHIIAAGRDKQLQHPEAVSSKTVVAYLVVSALVSSKAVVAYPVIFGLVCSKAACGSILRSTWISLFKTRSCVLCISR